MPMSQRPNTTAARIRNLECDIHVHYIRQAACLIRGSKAAARINAGVCRRKWARLVALLPEMTVGEKLRKMHALTAGG